MTGDDLEQALKRYRVAGPPARLRSRILESATPKRERSLPVWIAVSSLAASILLLIGGASSVYGKVGRSASDESERTRREQIASTAAVLGGSSLGLEEATAAVQAAESDATGALARPEARIQ